MELKDTSFIVIDNNKQQKVKCCVFYCKEFNRELIIHENIDNKSHTSVSDKKTGYRIFGLPIKPDKVKLEDLREPLEKFIKHFTMEAIIIEFKRIEDLQKKQKEPCDEQNKEEDSLSNSK